MNNFNRKKITVLIPCYNEENGIAEVIRKFPREKIEASNYSLEIMIVDNNSTDRTAEIARSLGATVITEKKKGKGNAVRKGFDSISEDTDYVVMLDGDDTYRPEEILRLVEPLESNFCEAVIGSRLLGRISDGSMTKMNLIGNRFFSTIVRFFYKVKVTDVLTGYFAWKKDTINRLRPHLKSPGFALEMEMVTKMAKLGVHITCIPISYDSRAGETNLHPIKDGLRILWMFTQNLYWKPASRATMRGSLVMETK